MSTALAEAFKSAGWQKPNDRLLDIALEAWGKWPGASMGGARRDFVAQRISGEMTYALIIGWNANLMPQAVGWLLNQARDAIENERDAAKAAGRSQSAFGAHQRNAPTQTNDATPQAERQSEGAKLAAKPNAPTPSRSNLTALADKQAARARTSAAVQVKLTRLDTVMVDGKPIGDCTVAEVRAWAARREADKRAAGRDAQFALNLVANLQGDVVIRQHWAPMLNDVDQMYDRAEADHAA